MIWIEFRRCHIPYLVGLYGVVHDTMWGVMSCDIQLGASVEEQGDV